MKHFFARFGLTVGLLIGTIIAAQANLSINATFGPSITSDPNAAKIESTINQAIAFYQMRVLTSVSVNITFQEESTGLGNSAYSYYTLEYQATRGQIATSATSADDSTALSHLPDQATDPVIGSSTLGVPTTLAIALGNSIAADDATISLNTSICNLDRQSIDPNKYDLYAVVCHEIDEVLGTGSLVGQGGDVMVADLFRYDLSGARSFTTDTTARAFFSIDGTSRISEYNQSGSGDYGDWKSGAAPPQIQDAFASPGTTLDPGPSELRLLDVIGYNVLDAGVDTYARVLWRNTSGAISLWTVNSQGQFSFLDYGPYTGWTAKLLSVGSDNKARIAWEYTTKQISLWTVAQDGSFTHYDYGPFAGWSLAALKTGDDNQPRAMWTNTNGAISLWKLASNGSSFQNLGDYGPYTGWTASKLAIGPDGHMRVMWVKTTGQISIWTLSAGGSFTTQDYGPYIGWSAVDLAVGPDNNMRVLWQATTGAVAVWRLTAPGVMTSQQFGPYTGFSCSAMDIGADNRERLMWKNTDGHISLWRLYSDWTFTQGSYGPYTGWDAGALSVSAP